MLYMSTVNIEIDKRYRFNITQYWVYGHMHYVTGFYENRPCRLFEHNSGTFIEAPLNVNRLHASVSHIDIYPLIVNIHVYDVEYIWMNQ